MTSPSCAWPLLGLVDELEREAVDAGGMVDDAVPPLALGVRVRSPRDRVGVDGAPHGEHGPVRRRGHPVDALGGAQLHLVDGGDEEPGERTELADLGRADDVRVLLEVQPVSQGDGVEDALDLVAAGVQATVGVRPLERRLFGGVGDVSCSWEEDWRPPVTATA